MGIHGDKSQQERDWVLNGNFHPHLSGCSELFVVFTNSFIYFRVQIWQSPDSHCHRCCFQGSRSVSSHMTFTIFKKKVYLLSLTLLLLSEFLPWPEGAVCVAGPWHDKPRFSRGGRRILGGVLTGEAWVSQSCRYTEVTRPECSRRTGLLKNRRGHAEGWAQFLPRVLLFSGNGLLSAPRLYNSSSSKPGDMYLPSCVYIWNMSQNLRIFCEGWTSNLFILFLFQDLL